LTIQNAIGETQDKAANTSGLFKGAFSNFEALQTRVTSTKHVTS